LYALVLVTDPNIAEEDRLRLHWYTLLGDLLAAPPDETTLARLAGLSGDETDLGQAIAALSEAARRSEAERLEQEYFDLFVAGGGELRALASGYLTGFRHERPLTCLRREMAVMGIVSIARDEAGYDLPEDHIASLCEDMAGLIAGRFGAPVDLATQRRFYDAHIGCWAPQFFEDLESAEAAEFYRPVGTIGHLFMLIEVQAFLMAA
jgi:TorA maturation chaperone TorD